MSRKPRAKVDAPGIAERAMSDAQDDAWMNEPIAADLLDKADAVASPPTEHAHTCPRCGFAGAMLAPPLPAEAPRVAASYRVARGGTFVWNGSVCSVKTGDVVQLRNYGEAGIANMRGRGIVLDPVV